MSYIPDLKLDAIRSFVMGIDGTAVATTTVYTVPTGFNFVLTRVVLQVLAVNTITVGPTITFGANNPSYNDYQAALVTNLTAPATCLTFHDSTVIPVYFAGQAIKLNITTGATAVSQMLGCGVFGILIPV